MDILEREGIAIRSVMPDCVSYCLSLQALQPVHRSIGVAVRSQVLQALVSTQWLAGELGRPDTDGIRCQLVSAERET